MKTYVVENKNTRTGRLNLSHTSGATTAQVMYIMAAVDVDVREATKAAKSRAAAPGASSRWRQGEDGVGVHAHEQVVCSIKAHQNGTLEIAPGAPCCIATYLMATRPLVVGFLVFCCGGRPSCTCTQPWLLSPVNLKKAADANLIGSTHGSYGPVS